MALTIGNTTNSITTPVISTVTFSHNNGGVHNNYLFLLVCTDLSATYSGVTYNGVSMTQIDTRTTTSTVERWAIYRLASPATGANNIVVTFGAAPFNPVSVFVVSMSECSGEGNIVFDDTAVSPNSTSITVSANSIILGAAVGGSNTGKAITLDGSSRTLEFTNSIYNYTYAAFSAAGLTAGSKTVSVSNNATVAGYYLEIKQAASNNGSGFFMMMN